MANFKMHLTGAAVGGGVFASFCLGTGLAQPADLTAYHSLAAAFMFWFFTTALSYQAFDFSSECGSVFDEVVSMVRKNSKQSSLASTVVVIVAAIIAAFIVYRQVFLVSKVTTNLPESALSRGLEACLQENLTPAQLKQEFDKANLSFDFYPP